MKAQREIKKDIIVHGRKVTATVKATFPEEKNLQANRQVREILLKAYNNDLRIM